MPIVNNSNWNMFMFAGKWFGYPGKPINADGDTMDMPLTKGNGRIHLSIEFETPTCDKPHHTITRCLSSSINSIHIHIHIHIDSDLSGSANAILKFKRKR